MSQLEFKMDFISVNRRIYEATIMLVSISCVVSEGVSVVYVWKKW